jgi:hypothetical protein
MHKVRGNYSSPIQLRSSENICSNNGGGAHEKGKRASKPDETHSVWHPKKWVHFS